VTRSRERNSLLIEKARTRNLLEDQRAVSKLAGKLKSLAEIAGNIAMLSVVMLTLQGARDVLLNLYSKRAEGYDWRGLRGPRSSVQTTTPEMTPSSSAAVTPKNKSLAPAPRLNMS
jgi:hypothetical protein